MLLTDAVIHQFLLEEIGVEVVSEKDLLDFTYNAKKRIAEVLLKLRESGQAMRW